MVCEETSSQTAPSSDLFRIASVDSSSSSAESSFRELDDAFLQTQTRIWLGEVLQIRLDEKLVISELLADGELLFQVSKVVWKLLLAKHMELRHLKVYKNQPFASKKKNSGRYRPYSNVDSFLKICKILGLTGVDLFSPSDVVERRNTRRVCMCIRSFSKKSRSMNINVPDFDIVTCMVAMPKDLVGCIRRNIELSHSILADSSSSYYLQKHARGLKSRQGYSVTSSTGDYKTYSDQSDDTENKHSVLQFDDLHSDDDLYDYSSEMNYDLESPMVEDVYMPEDLDQLDIQNQERNVFGDDFELLCSMESSQYHCPENIEHDCKQTWSSSPPFGDLRTDLIGMTSHLDNRVEQVQGIKFMDFNYFEHLSLSNNASVIRTPPNDKTPGARDVSSHAKHRKDPDLFHEENSKPNIHQSASSHGSNPTPQTAENGKCLEIGDSMEVAGMSLNLGDQFDAEKNFKKIESFKFHNEKNDQWDKIKEYESQGIMKCKEMTYDITSNARYSYFVTKYEETEHSLYSPDCYFCNPNSSDRDVLPNNEISSTSLKKLLACEERDSQVDLERLDNASCNQSEEFLSYQSYYLPESCKWDQKGKGALASYRDKGNKNSSCFLEDGLCDETTPCKHKASEILTSKVIFSCVPNEEDVISAAAIKLGTDDKERNNNCKALASNAPGVDDGDKYPTLGDDANDFCNGVTTQDIGDRDQRVPDLITNDVVVPAQYDEDVSLTESYITNLTSKLELNDGHQTCQYEKDSEHTPVLHIKEGIKPDDESVKSLENLEVGDIEIPKARPQKKLLLKTVLGGAAAVGLLFMILHLRRNGREKAAQPSMASSDKSKDNIQNSSPRKVKRLSTTKGVYPAEKLKLK